MAITDTSPTAAAAPAQTAARPAAVPAPSGVAGVLGSGDHKTLGRLYLGFSLAFGLVAISSLALFDVRATMASVVPADTFGNFTLGQVSLILLFVLPLFVGLATAVVPLQVGASTIAFPRAAAAALWAWVLSALLLLVSYLPSVKGGIGSAGDVNGVTLTYLALVGLIVALLLGTVCVMTTIVTLRPAGLSLDRVPLFSWSMLVAGGMWLLTLPAAAANALFIFVELKYGTAGRFSATDAQWAQLGWLVTPPQVFAYAIPALGIVGDVVATHARVRTAPRSVVTFAIGAFGALSFGAYVQPAVVRGVFHMWPTIFQNALIVLPVLALLAVFATMVRKGRIAVTAPVILGVVALLLVLLAALAAAPFGVAQDLQTPSPELLVAVPSLAGPAAGSSLFALGVFAMVIAAAIGGAVAGLFHWSSKITGRQLPDGLGKLLGLLVLLAGVLFGAPLLAIGARFGGADGAKMLLSVSAAGALLLLAVTTVSLLLMLAHRLRVIRGGATAPADAWGSGQTLEWAADSPPAPGNFGELPVVTSPEPLLDLADGGER